MVAVEKVKKYNEEVIDTVSDLHLDAFPDFFLTNLGKSFISLLYRCYVEDKESGIIVAKDEEEIVGFIAYSNDYPAFYKNLIRKHCMKFALCSLGALVKHPSFSKRLLGAFRKSDDVKKEEKYVEIASICVDPKKSKKGTGTLLMEYIKNDVDFDTYAYINLETDADNNDGVNKFYVKNSFKLERTYTTREGRRMNEYRYRGSQ